MPLSLRAPGVTRVRSPLPGHLPVIKSDNPVIFILDFNNLVRRPKPVAYLNSAALVSQNACLMKVACASCARSRCASSQRAVSFSKKINASSVLSVGTLTLAEHKIFSKKGMGAGEGRPRKSGKGARDPGISGAPVQGHFPHHSC